MGVRHPSLRRLPAPFRGAEGSIAATRILSVGIEDVLDMQDQVNIPGTVTQHPNWRRRLPVDLEELSNDQRLARISSALVQAGRGSG